MRICSGDLVNVKNIIFKNGVKDHAEDGRPCLVLYCVKEDEEKYIVLAPLSSRIDLYEVNKNIDFEKYIYINNKNSISKITSIFKMKLEDQNISEATNNIGLEFLEIAKKLRKNYRVSGENFNIDLFEEMLLNNEAEIKELLEKRSNKFKHKYRYVNKFIFEKENRKKASGKMGHYKKILKQNNDQKYEERYY